MAGDMHEKLLIPDDELGNGSLGWQGEELSLADILEKHNLPILVQIVQGYYDDLSSQRFSGSEIIRLDCRLPVDFIEASVLHFKSTDKKNKDASVDKEKRPVSTLFSSSLMLPKSLSSVSFEVVDDTMRHKNNESSELIRGKSRRRSLKSTATSQRKTLKRKTRFESVKSLAKHRPEFVRVLKLSNTIKKGTQLQVGQRLHILDVPETRFFQDKYLRCQVVDTNETVGIIKLNLKWKGVFELNLERQSFLLQEIVDTYTLPATVRMQDSTLSNKWTNARISTRMKQIRTLDLNVRLEREVAANPVIGIMKGIDGDDSVVVMSENVKYRFRVSSEMQSRSSSYEQMMSSIGGLEKETIPPEIFLSEHGSPIFALHKKYEMQLGATKLSKRRALLSRHSVVSMLVREPNTRDGYINISSTQILKHPSPPKEATIHQNTMVCSQSEATGTLLKQEDQPLHKQRVSTSPQNKEVLPHRDDDIVSLPQSPGPIEVHRAVNTDDAHVTSPGLKSKSDSIPRGAPPPIPYRKRGGKSRSFWSARRLSFRRNPAAENRPLPDVPPKGGGDKTTVAADRVSTKSRRNTDRVRRDSSRSPSLLRECRRTVSDVSPTSKHVDMDMLQESYVSVPPLPPCTPTLDGLNRHPTKRRNHHSRRHVDFSTWSPKSIKERRARFEDGDPNSDTHHLLHSSRRHHPTQKRGEKNREKYSHKRKMSTPSLHEAPKDDCEVDYVNLPLIRVSAHTFHEVTDADGYLIPHKVDPVLTNKEDVEQLENATASERLDRQPTPKHVRVPERKFNSTAELPRDITDLTCGELTQAMQLLNMRDEIVHLFSTHLVNGALLRNMQSDMLKSEFALTDFELFKVTQFVSGWRP